MDVASVCQNKTSHKNVTSKKTMKNVYIINPTKEEEESYNYYYKGG